MAGHEKALRNLYDISFKLRPAVSAEAWEMKLIPHQSSLKKVLQDVQLQGQGVVLETMKIREVSGVEKITIFSHVKTTRQFTKTEEQQLFQLPE